MEITEELIDQVIDYIYGKDSDPALITKLCNGVLDSYLYYDREQFLQDVEREVVANNAEEKGIERGKSENRIENAKAFLKKGINKEFVIETLNLTPSEIKILDI